MKRNMKLWARSLLESSSKKALPILSFPAVQLMGIRVCDLIKDSDAQARGMKLIAERTDAAASVSLMDLSVEAECFGSVVRTAEDEVPTVIGGIVSSEKEVDELKVPAVGTARSGLYVEAIRKAVKLIEDRPVFAGVIGPFSLSARLMDVTQCMLLCYDEPDMVHALLKKSTQFLTEYCRAYKEAGANGVVIAEPVAGLLSPALSAEFSGPYVKQIVDAVQDDSFLVIYHNCGDAVPTMLDSIISIGAAAYHFGNAIDMAQIMGRFPENVLVMGNIDPAGEFRNGTPESISAATLKLLNSCCQYSNFVISSGCDIPPMSRWENIDAFFDTVRSFYIGH